MKVVIADYPDSMMPNHDYEREILTKGLGANTEIVVYPYHDDKEEFYEVIKDAQAILTAFTPIDAETLDHALQLQVVSINATGYDNVDLAAANARHIGVCPVGEYCTKDVAEFTIATMMALVKNLKSYQTAIDCHYHWSYDYAKPNQRLSDMTLGICGLGKIGKTVARKALGLGLKVLACDPFTHLPADLAVTMVSKEALFAQADIITNHMNLNETNYGYFDQKAFKQMLKQPYFINMGRGACVVEADVITALDQGRLKGAALDVLKDETPDLAQHPLVGRENVLITPHAAFYSTSSLRDLQRISTENIVHYLTGRKDRVFKLVSDY
ncbi:NAD(P)-dependent oxidoreductase [Streptococcus halichoeri]|uniref:NAD(P)-dependent oxidoreductase n=1 Tax=Streptococcus halichoeri TaxID=254785 RepID=UPI0013571F92|nr:NAD(P)-dependent oxidoreductase [Streptococcus halichoeri]